MSKIHITGNAGAGKSTLAHELGSALDLPVYGLDKIVWQPGWVKTPRDIVIARERELASRPEWVIEGVSHIVRDAADTVIFLDVDRRTAYFRCAKRNWKYLFKGRPELPENCPEIRILPQLAKIIWKFNTRVRPRILEDASQNPSRFLVVRSEEDLRQTYENLGVAV